jgi:hypothetical protein
LLLCLVTAGCQVRPLSSPYARSSWDSDPLYKGELSEADVIGAVAGSDEPGALLAHRNDVRLARGTRLLVIQSGALLPDETMLQALGARFTTGMLSGVPRASDAGLDVRRIAALGGYQAVLCYWGTLEAAREPGAGKAVSWVPIAGWFVSDETQRMRIRLRMMVVDVASGSWVEVVPPPFEDTRFDTRVTRDTSDLAQVVALKDAAYRAACDELVRQIADS